MFRKLLPGTYQELLTRNGTSSMKALLRDNQTPPLKQTMFIKKRHQQAFEVCVDIAGAT